MSSSRLETFADGVFAIAATLLILNVDGPLDPDGRLSETLAHLWPSYLAYAVSFVTIGILWVNHHTIMAFIPRVDRTFLFLNVGFLMCVAFVPFPTRVVAAHARTSEAAAAAVVYGVTLTLTALLLNALWLYAARGGRLLGADSDSRVVDGITRSYAPGPVIYAAATALAFVTPRLSIGLFAAIALAYVAENSLFAHADRRLPADESSRNVSSEETR